MVIQGKKITTIDQGLKSHKVVLDVTTLELRPISFDSFIEIRTLEISKLVFPYTVTVEETTISGLPARIMRYTLFSDGKRTRFVQYLCARNELIYFFTFSFNIPKEERTFSPVFKRITNSIIFYENDIPNNFIKNINENKYIYENLLDNFGLFYNSDDWILLTGAEKGVSFLKRGREETSRIRIMTDFFIESTTSQDEFDQKIIKSIEQVGKCKLSKAKDIDIASKKGRLIILKVRYENMDDNMTLYIQYVITNQLVYVIYFKCLNINSEDWKIAKETTSSFYLFE